MDHVAEIPTIIEERRLISTLLNEKPRSESFLVALATVVVTILSTYFYWEDPIGISKYLPAIRENVFGHGEWWRVVSAIFIHADFGHLVSNLYMLAIFSFFVFGYFGVRIFPIVAFGAAALTNALSIYSYSPETQLLGASGLVYVLGGFWLTMYFFIQRQYDVINRLVRVLGIGFMIFFPTTFEPTTSYRTHAIGFAAGILIGVIYFARNKKALRSRERFKINLIEV